MIRFARPLAAALVLSAAGTLALPASSARAADAPPSAAAPADKLAPARALIAEGKWRDAIASLQQINDTGSADWNNLMGYSHRKAKTPDFAAAERYYDEALRIDPKHRGALEYSGELYLMKGDLPRAEARLAALDKACFLGCSEYRELRAAINAYKANGSVQAARP
jgi:tetratricopeptide (TPR) repeat protein